MRAVAGAEVGHWQPHWHADGAAAAVAGTAEAIRPAAGSPAAADDAAGAGTTALAAAGKAAAVCIC